MDVRTHKADTPERICHVSQTQLSMARHFGGITYNGASYTYISADDSLVRNDVLKRDERLRRQHAAEERQRWKQAQQSLLDSPGHAPG